MRKTFKYSFIRALNAPTLIMPMLMLMLMLMLSGCNTTQTLAAQFGAAPLPTKVARKLYGVCGYCDPNQSNQSNQAKRLDCNLCLATQAYNRKRAGASKAQQSQFPRAGMDWNENRYQNRYQNQYHGYSY